MQNTATDVEAIIECDSNSCSVQIHEKTTTTTTSGGQTTTIIANHDYLILDGDSDLGG